MQCQCCSDCNAGCLSRRKKFNGLVSEGLQRELSDEFLSTIGGFTCGVTTDAQSELQLLTSSSGGKTETNVLGNIPNQPCGEARRSEVAINFTYGELSVDEAVMEVLAQTRNAFEDCSLARPGLPGENSDLTCRDGEGDVVENGLLAVTKCEVI